MDPKTVKSVRLIARELAMLTRVDVDDLNQEGLIAAWKAAETWDGRGTLDRRCTWLARMAMIDYIRWWTHKGRSATKPAHISLSEIGVKWDEWDWRERPSIGSRDVVAMSTQPIAETAVYIQEAVEAVNRSNMSNPYKTALLAMTLGDMTQPECAAKMGVTFGRVSQIVARATQHMRTKLGARNRKQT